MHCLLPGTGSNDAWKWMLHDRPGCCRAAQCCMGLGHAQHAGAAAFVAEGTELIALGAAEVAADESLLYVWLFVTLQANAGRTVQVEFLRQGRLVQVQLNLHGRLGCHLRPL